MNSMNYTSPSAKPIPDGEVTVRVVSRVPLRERRRGLFAEDAAQWFGQNLLLMFVIPGMIKSGLAAGPLLSGWLLFTALAGFAINWNHSVVAKSSASWLWRIMVCGAMSVYGCIAFWHLFKCIGL